MELEYGPEYDVLRDEVATFLAETPRDIDRRDFLKAATERGYLYRHIPRRFGGSEQPFDPIRETIVATLFDASPFSWRLAPQSTGMLVPTLLEAGSDAQREKFIPPTLLGDSVWCQGYSEPGAGSDLASLRSTARLDGDHWILNGQKIWTSDADHAGFMFGMFRTEPDADKHAGISYLLLEMNQPGLDVRPLKQITGSSLFSEVFMTNARADKSDLIGTLNGGWGIAQTTLGYERGANSLGRVTRYLTSFRQLVKSTKEQKRNGTPLIEDAVVRAKLGRIFAELEIQRYAALRVLSALSKGEPISSASSIT